MSEPERIPEWAMREAKYEEGDIVVADSGEARQLRRDPESPTGWTWDPIDFKPRWYHHLLGFGFDFLRRRQT